MALWFGLAFDFGGSEKIAGKDDLAQLALGRGHLLELPESDENLNNQRDYFDHHFDQLDQLSLAQVDLPSSRV